jgi:hypothetical protein
VRRGASGTAACPFLTEIWIFEIKKKTGVFETIGMEILQDNTIKSVFSCFENALCKKKIFHHIKLVIHVWSTKCR